MKKIHVGYVLHSLAIGGAEKYVVDLANSLDRNMFRVSIFCLKAGGALLNNLFPDVTVHVLDKKNGNQFNLPSQLSKLYKKEKVDIVHSNNWGTQGEAAISAKLAGKKIIHTQHGLEKNDQETICRRYFRNKARRFFSGFSDSIVAVSEATRSFICQEWKVRKEKVSLIYNGVSPISQDLSARQEIRRELAIDNESILIGSVGRLMPVKNYQCLIRAFAELAHKGLNVRLALVGDGGQRDDLERMTKQMGVNEKTFFLGFRSDVHRFLQAFDIFVLSSFSEGVSLALLEAMSAALPVVATEVGGNQEVVQQSETGFLVPSDHYKALAAALETLIKGNNLITIMGRNGKERVNQLFSFNKMITAHTALYERLSQ